jgi:cyanate permease
VCGNVGAALAAGITAVLATWLGWRGAFLVPAALCVVTGVLYLRLVPDDGPKAATRSQQADVPLSRNVMATMFGLFIMIALSIAAVVTAIALRRFIVPQFGEWNATLLAAASYLILVAVAGFLLPSINEVPDEFPAVVLWNFRIASIGAQLIMWGTFGLLFGTLTERAFASVRPRA